MGGSKYSIYSFIIIIAILYITVSQSEASEVYLLVVFLSFHKGS